MIFPAFVLTTAHPTPINRGVEGATDGEKMLPTEAATHQVSSYELFNLKRRNVAKSRFLSTRRGRREASHFIVATTTRFAKFAQE